jgi:dihydrofolate reductase
MPLLSLIVAAAENDVIGRDNQLPWHLPDDLKRFKALTMGKPMLMGRKTFESIGKPLPGRTSIVLTRSPGWKHDGVIVVQSIDEAIQRAGAAAELAVIGGTEVFRATLPRADRIYLTRVHAEIDGDATMPNIDPQVWREGAREHHPADERHAYPMTFMTLERVR